MTFKFSCPHCGQRIAATSEDAGTEGICSTCQNTFTVPEPPEPDTPPPVSKTAPHAPKPSRMRRLLLPLLVVLLLAGGAAAYFLWPYRSPAAVVGTFLQASVGVDFKTVRRMVTASSLHLLDEPEKEVEAMRKKAPAEVEKNLEKNREAVVEITGTTHHGGIAVVNARVIRPEQNKSAIATKSYVRRTWLGWRVDLELENQIQKDSHDCQGNQHGHPTLSER